MLILFRPFDKPPSPADGGIPLDTGFGPLPTGQALLRQTAWPARNKLETGGRACLLPGPREQGNHLLPVRPGRMATCTQRGARSWKSMGTGKAINPAPDPLSGPGSPRATRFGAGHFSAQGLDRTQAGKQYHCTAVTG